VRERAGALGRRPEGRNGDAEAVFSVISWVPVGAEVARAAGELARQYRRAHGAIEPIDYMIAATALLLEAELLTKNVKHFPMISGLEPPY
jgi:hypothetical protein